jgi:hypothetical protein
MIGRLRSLAPPWFVTLGMVFFLIAEAFLQYHERRLGVALEFRVRPSLVVLYVLVALYGAYRAFASHPFFNSSYQDWLAQTPWTIAKPLPFDPIQLCGRDAVVLGSLIALNLIAPQKDSMRILCVFLWVHCALLTAANWLTTNRAYAYLALFGLAFMIRLWGHPWVCVANGALVYLVVHEGVWQALRAFPWKQNYALLLFPEVAIRDGNEKPIPPCGWPYDRLLREPDAKNGSPETGLDALIWSLLLGWWVSCLASRFTEQSNAITFIILCTGAVLMISLIARGAYMSSYIWPLGPIGRIATGRLIIPRYDIVLAALLIMPLAIATAVIGFSSCGVPTEIYGPSLPAIIMFLAMRTPPGLRRWRLTGGHRMVPDVANTKFGKDFVKVG